MAVKTIWVKERQYCEAGEEEEEDAVVVDAVHVVAFLVVNSTQASVGALGEDLLVVEVMTFVL